MNASNLGITTFVLTFDGSTQSGTAMATTLSGEILGFHSVKHKEIEGLPSNHHEMETHKFLMSAATAGKRLMRKLGLNPANCKGACAGGQMHGHILVDYAGNYRWKFERWDDSRDKSIAAMLTKEFRVPFARRFTFARHMGAKRRRGGLQFEATMVLTPGAFLAYMGCGVGAVMAGDASGMVGYRRDPFKFNTDQIAEIDPTFASLLPPIVRFGEKIGETTVAGSKLFGIPVGTPWAGSCGDQSLASIGNGICEHYEISVEDGSSGVVNAFGYKPIFDQCGLIEALNSPLGDDWSMCCVVNNSTGFDAYVKFIHQARGGKGKLDRTYDFVYQEVAKVSINDLLPLVHAFFSAETTLKHGDQTFASIQKLTASNFTVGQIGLGFLLGPLLILRRALRLITQGERIDALRISGGGARRQSKLQLIANVLGETVCPSQTTQAVAFGAAINTITMVRRLAGETVDERVLIKRLAKSGNAVKPAPGLTELFDRAEEEYFGADARMRRVWEGYRS